MNWVIRNKWKLLLGAQGVFTLVLIARRQHHQASQFGANQPPAQK